MKIHPPFRRTSAAASLLLTLAVLAPTALAAQQPAAQEKPAKTFTDVKVLPATSVKNQASTGTCWDFATLSFLESELLRMGKGEYDLSEMYIVDHVYREKADLYYRWHGNQTFGPGGLSHDVLTAIAKWGIVPNKDFTGLWPYETRHNHGELQNVLKADLDAVLRTRPGPSPKWSKGFDALLDAYLGPLPERIQVNGTSMTPVEFSQDVLGLDPSAYVEIMSFTDQPYWTQGALETTDNWVHDQNTWNLPLDDAMGVIRHAVESGYTVAIGADVSEPEFDQGAGYASWHEGETITPEAREAGWDRWTTTDDHTMHLVGIAHDENGVTYYRVKNSWGDVGPYHGYIYMSENYIRAKFDLLMVNRDALPADVREKMGG
ncbi:MAG: C1 family peptidase [Gemmatimonadetes bacterium]|nr:C1 family peptidase [Gemmatimonadota bacterium]